MKKIFSLLSFLLTAVIAFGQVSDANINTHIQSVRSQGFDPVRTATPLQDLEDSKIGTLALQATGTNTYAVSVFNSHISAYLSGQLFPVYFQNGNTTAATINLNSMGAKAIVKNTSTPLISGDIPTGGRLAWLYYDGTNFRLSLTGSGGGGGSGDMLAANNLSDVASASTSRTNLGLAIGVNVEAHDANLTAIAGISPSNDDVIQRKAGVWVNRSMAQIKIDLSLNNVDNTSDATKNAAAVSLTNHTINGSLNTITNISLSTAITGVLGVNSGGTGANLSDPNANKFLGWDDTDNANGFWSIGSGLSYDHSTHTISGTGGAPFADNSSHFKNNADNTKQAIIDVSNVPTSTINSYNLSSLAGPLSILRANRSTHGGDYTLALADYTGGKLVEMTSSSANNLTLPDDATVAFPVGAMIEIMRSGTGVTTILAGGSSTVTASSGQLADNGRNQSFWAEKTASNTWLVRNGSALITGDIAIDVGGVSAYSGVVPANKGGTGTPNNVASTLAISGNFGITLSVSGTTSIALPVDGAVLAIGGSSKTIDGTSFTQEWQFNTLAGASGLKLTSTSTAATGNVNKVLQVLTSGANSTSAQTTFAIEGNNTKTGTTGINIGVQASASGGSINRALRVTGLLEVSDTEYATPTNETSTLAFFRKDQNAISAVYIINTSNTASSRASIQLSTSATVATSVFLQATPAAGTTSGIIVASTAILGTDISGGLNIGTTGATQVSIWTNNSQKLGFTSTGNATHTNVSGGTTGYMWTWTQSANSTGIPGGLKFTGGAHANITTGTEMTDILIDLSATTTVAGSTALALNRSFRITPRTFTAASATTWTDVGTFVVGGAPTGGGAGPLTITNPWSILIEAGNSKSFGKWVFDATLTTTGTTGNQTINKPAGTANIAAAGTAVTITNSFVTANSLVIPWVITADTTAKSCSAVSSSGSFVVTLNAAATAETKIGFMVFN